jgi:hypothetical protein
MVYLGKRRPGKRAEMVLRKGTEIIRKKDFTLILCFSRTWCYIKFFEHFEKLRFDMKSCHLLIIDNSDNTKLRDLLLDRAKVYAGAFRSVRLYKTWRIYQRPLLTAKVITWKDSQNGPILGMHLDALRLTRTRRFVMIEDDTLVPPHAVSRLLNVLDENRNCGMATGIQAMRQSAAYMVSYPAVYYVKREGGRIVENVSLSPYLRGLHQIDGTGWYCFASYKDVFLRATREIMKQNDKIRNHAVDVLHTYFIRSFGYDVIADFGVWTGHYMVAGKEGFTWEKKHCKPMLSKWIPEWQTYSKVTNMKEPVHYKLLGRLTRRKDRHWKR